MNERWIKVTDRYSISDQGRFRNDQTGTIRKPGEKKHHGRSYLIVDWNVGGRKVHRAVAVLVLEHFVGPRPEGMEALHRDDDTLNNALINLYWGTHSQNMLDKVRNGNHHLAKKTHCGRCGEPLSGSNIRVNKRNYRCCRNCARHGNRIRQGYYERHPEEWPLWAKENPPMCVRITPM